MSGEWVPVCVVGAGRMGEGIALAFAQAGQCVHLIDLKPRDEAAQLAYFTVLRASLSGQLQSLQLAGLLSAEQVEAIQRRIQLVALPEAAEVVVASELLFEALPEILEVKRHALGWISRHAPTDAIIASTTSTFLLTELAPMVSAPQRLINAHWLNPAQLMPLVEISRSEVTCDEVVHRLKQVVLSIGKVPVVCGVTPGYIVPRLQALVMNEAARMVAEGVASAEDIDTAVRTGFGLRFSVLGLLEFIDWGGGDILYHASQYLERELGERFAPAPQVMDNMHNQRNGLRDGRGFYDYAEVDTAQYRQRRLRTFVERLEHTGLLPRIE